jgi:ABC-type transport system substrate-binding protein
MLWGGIPGYTDADDFLFNELDSSGGTNQIHLRDTDLDAMIDHERTLINEGERLKTVQDIQKYIAQKLYMPSTVGTFQWALVQPRVQNYQYSSTNGRLDETYPKLWLKS